MEQKCNAVLESTSNMWMRIHDTLEDNVIDTLLANTYKTKVIAQAKIKSDKPDARILADLLRTGLIYESYVPVKEFREKEVLSDTGSIVSNQNKTSKQGPCYFRQI